MKYFLIILLILNILSCGKDDNDSQPKNNITPVEGFIEHQNAGPKNIYEAKNAYFTSGNEDQYKLFFGLTTNDSLLIGLKKFSNDLNYHFPKPFNENQLLFVIWNTDTLLLDNSAVSLQPTTQQTYQAVIDIHTLDFGDLNGTIKNIPLIISK